MLRAKKSLYVTAVKRDGVNLTRSVLSSEDDNGLILSTIVNSYIGTPS